MHITTVSEGIRPLCWRKRTAFLAPCLAVVAAATAIASPEPFWRSQLYPMDWAPDYEDGQGRFFHDFSYAGYHNGEGAIPDNPPGEVFDVVADFAADNTGQTDATAAIQQAIDAAALAGGGIVFVPAGLYRCDGELIVTQSGTVLRGEGENQTRIYFTKFTGLPYRGHIVVRGAIAQGPDLPLAVDGVSRSPVVYVDDASSLSVGDDISVGWVITDEFVAEHGMTGTWTVFNGDWKPFFRREVVAVDTSVTPHEVRLDVPLRYAAKMRDGASVRKETGHLEECGIEMMSLANAVDYDDAWLEEAINLIQLHNAKDCWMRRVSTFISPADPEGKYHLQSGGIRMVSVKRVTVADCRLELAQNRGYGGCGYLYQILTSNEVLIRDCIGNAGRHNFVQNWGFGTAGCVFLRCNSSKGRARNGFITIIGFSEYHHSLAMACLVDQCEVEDGWAGGNREDQSTGAGHTVTENVYWNTSGVGQIRSWAYGLGYVIGTTENTVLTTVTEMYGVGTEPEDYTEGLGTGSGLLPRSLYEDQFARRLGRVDSDGDGIRDSDEESGTHGYFTDPRNPDTDGDGLTDLDEVMGSLGPATDPTLAYTDGDGVGDYEEVVLYHTDPNDAGDTPLSGLRVPFFQ